MVNLRTQVFPEVPRRVSEPSSLHCDTTVGTQEVPETSAAGVPHCAPTSPAAGTSPTRKEPSRVARTFSHGCCTGAQLLWEPEEVAWLCGDSRGPVYCTLPVRRAGGQANSAAGVCGEDSPVDPQRHEPRDREGGGARAQAAARSAGAGHAATGRGGDTTRPFTFSGAVASRTGVPQQPVDAGRPFPGHCMVPVWQDT